MKKTKETVRCKSFLDGVLRKQWTETRMVYETRNGLTISDLGRRKLVTRAADGVVDVEYHTRTIAPVRLNRPQGI